LRNHFVHRNEAELVKSTIREKGRHKVIDKVSVYLNDKLDVYEAYFANLGIGGIRIDTDTVKKHQRLLVSGVWCIADLGYEFSDNPLVSPWILNSLKPIQISHFDLDAYLEARKQFSTEEWIDRDGISKTFSGLMKILFPHGDASQDEMEEILDLAVEGRKRIKDQLMRIDPTYAEVNFGYTVNSSKRVVAVSTLEERQYPRHYWQNKHDGESEEESQVDFPELLDNGTVPASCSSATAEAREQHLIFQENQRGVSFDRLLGPYLKNAGKIVITDPYIRIFFQVRNLMELLETIIANKSESDEVEVELITVRDEYKEEQQVEYFAKMATSCQAAGVAFSWIFAEDNSIHARHIVIDNGWKILLDRGLDIFQCYEMNDAFSIANRMQQFRPCKAFEATFLRADSLHKRIL